MFSLNSTKMCKKAQATNYFAVIVTLFISGFLIILSSYIITQYTQAFEDAGYTGAVKETGESFLAGVHFLDNLMILFALVLVVGIGITSYRLATKPIFFIMTLIFGAFYGFISYYFNYIFVSMVNQSVFSTTLLFFPRTILLCTNLHWIMLLEIIIGTITLFGKKEQGQYLA